jgi:DNA-binding NtrC family response regulator
MAAKILMVEDQNAFMLRELLELYGQFEFELVTDGCTAIEKLAGPLPDLILLDLRLPGVGGMVVLDAIRKVDSRFPVIIVSAYGDKCTRQEAAERGANDFFQKPVSTMRLYRRIKELLAAAPRRNSYDTLILEGKQAELLAKHRRLLKLRRALLGIDAPPELFIEIEDLEEELEDAHS